MKKVIVIVGPTASGKTSLAIKLAKALNTEIISGDSVQVYRELSIGSAKVTEQEQQGIKHHLIDVTSIRNPYSAFNFQKDARICMESVKIPIICGGTGFYIQSLLYDYQFESYQKHDEENTQTHVEKIAELKTLMPNIDIDFNNDRRVTSALRLAKQGINRNDQKNQKKLLYEPLVIYLNIDKSIYDEILLKRIDKQIEDGFIDEVKAVNKPLNIIGYREIWQHLQGELSLNDAKKQIMIKSRQLAKRQKTWFVNQMDIHPFEFDDPLLFEKVYHLSLKFLKGGAS